MALVLLDLIGPSRSHAGFGSRRGRLSPSHDRVRSETRNKPASPKRPICSLLGAINFPQGRLFASSCAAVSEHTLQYSQCPLSRYNLSWGNLALNFYRVREGATLPQAFICPLALSAGCPPSVSAASIAAIRQRGLAPWQPKLTEASNNSGIEQFIASESERTT